MQVWVGNMPAGTTEQQAREELAAYGVRPPKVVCRHRERGEGFCILTMASEQLAAVVLAKEAWWSSGRFMLFRPLVSMVTPIMLCSMLAMLR